MVQFRSVLRRSSIAFLLVAALLASCTRAKPESEAGSPPLTSPASPSPVVSKRPAPPPDQATAVATPDNSNAPRQPPGLAESVSDAADSETSGASGNVLLSKIQKDIAAKVTVAKQDTGKTYLSTLLLSQQAEKLVRGRFTSDLKRLAPELQPETDEYRLEIQRADQSQTVMVAIARQPGFASYTGVAYAVEAGIPVTGICKTNEPSQVPPSTPKLVNAGILCPSGSAAVQ